MDRGGLKIFLLLSLVAVLCNGVEPVEGPEEEYLPVVSEMSFKEKFTEGA